MGFYKRRPSIVRAIQWNGINYEEVRAWVKPLAVLDNMRLVTLTFHCAKSDANVTIQCGDWIIAEPDGDGFYPCAGDIFAASYEEAD